MILEWTLENFKSIKGPETLTFAPLTVLAGANSSGKSTILQSILLISQTLSSRIRARHLVLNGELVRLGEWSDILHRARAHDADAPDDDISIGFRLSGPRDRSDLTRTWMHRRVSDASFLSALESVSLQAAFALPRADSSGDPGQRHPVLERLVISTASSAQGTERGPAASAIRLGRRAEVSADLERLVTASPALAQGLQYRPTLQGVAATTSRPSRGRVQANNVVGAFLRHFIPDMMLGKVDEREERLDAIRGSLEAQLRYPSRGYAAYRGSQPAELPPDLVGQLLEEARKHATADAAGIDDLSGIARLLRGARMHSRSQYMALRERLLGVYEQWSADVIERTKAEPAVVPCDVPAPFEDVISWVESELGEAVQYLGPLRDDPKPVYGLPPSGDPTEVGLKGEFTAAVLDTYSQARIKYCRPEVESPSSGRLCDAVIEWLRHFALLESVGTSSAGTLGHRLFVRTHDVPGNLDLTNVGVGVSQILPILVMSLLAGQGSILVFEQPEIHLHPSVQSRLADFFISLVACGKQCIIETHSEYIVNRLRRRVAEDAEDKLRDKISLYFVEKPGAESSFRHVRINSFGAIPDWPAGFFDEGPFEAEHIINAGISKRTRGGSS